MLATDASSSQQAAVSEAFLKAAHDPAPGERDFAQDDLLLLGGSRPVCLRSNREKALSSRLAFGGRLSRPRSVNVVLKPLGETFAADERLAALQAIPVRQFVCRPGAHLDLALPGALVLFACAPGLVHGLLRRGAPWVLSFDAVRSADEDLANVAVRDRVMRLVTLHCFLVVGGSPPASSFSRAIRPAVRSRVLLAFLGFLPLSVPRSLLTTHMHYFGYCSFVTTVFRASSRTGSCSPTLPSFGSNSGRTFRADLCQFGCLCTCHHQLLLGFCSLNGQVWRAPLEARWEVSGAASSLDGCCQ